MLDADPGLGRLGVAHDVREPLGDGRHELVGDELRKPVDVTDDAQLAAAKETRDTYQEKLTAAGYGSITTEIAEAGPFFYAEEYHQQYLAKNPNGYCNHGFCQVAYSSS